MKFSKGFLLTLLASISWAISIVLVRYLCTHNINAYNIVFWTTIFGVPIWLLTLKNKSKELKKLAKKDYLLLIILGLISGLGVSVIEIIALKYSPAVNFSFINRTVILFTILLAWLFLGEKPTLKKNILALLILVGSFLLITKGRGLTLGLGDIFTLLEAIFISFSNILAKFTASKIGPDLSASIQYLVGVLPILIFCVFVGGATAPTALFLLVLITVLYFGVTFFRFRALEVSPASYVTMIFSFTPVFVSLMAIPLLGESLAPIQILGGGLIILAGIFVEKLKI